MKKIFIASVFLLGACSSPPEAPKVDWEKKSESMNSQLMSWEQTDLVIKSSEVKGKWDKKIVNFIPENRLYDDATFYSIAHSEKIIIETKNSIDYFNAKKWLREHGATGVIGYKENNQCFICSTNIYLSR